jgi:hypothetical protein
VKIKLTSVFVDDQDKVLKLYTEILGFIKKRDLPVGEFDVEVRSRNGKYSVNGILSVS